MTTIDDAAITPVIVLRPSSFEGANHRSAAALVVRFPGAPLLPEDTLREAVLRGLLRRGWHLVSAPVGEFDPPWSIGQHTPVVSLGDDYVHVKVSSETLYEGPLGLAADTSGSIWLHLAHSTNEVLVLVTAGSRPVTTVPEIDTTARAGYLVGLPGRLRTPKE